MTSEARAAGARMDLAGGGNPAAGGTVAIAASRGWLVSPLFDLLFFINIYWVVAFLPFYASADGEPYIQFWMAYFLATPHRWLTLVVAAADQDRRYGQTWLFLAIGVACALLIGGVLWVTGDFRTLFLFYTLLLGWHFAGQHSIILRIYSGRAGGGHRHLEKWLPMIFVVYTNVRLISFLEPILRIGHFSALETVDFAMLGIPLLMVVRELLHFSRQRLPKLLYMVSFFGMWISVLWSAHLHRDALCAVLLGAVTVYHSVEYMAMVSYYAWRRQAHGSHDLFQKMARRWTVVFAWYVIGCGLLYSIGNALFVVACYAVNTWASLLHCFYDGIMWRVDQPKTAEAFGIEAAAAVPESAA